MKGTTATLHGQIDQSAFAYIIPLRHVYGNQLENITEQNSLLAVTWIVAGLPPRRIVFSLRPIRVGFVVDQVALGQV